MKPVHVVVLVLLLGAMALLCAFCVWTRLLNAAVQKYADIELLIRRGEAANLDRVAGAGAGAGPAPAGADAPHGSADV